MKNVLLPALTCFIDILFKSTTPLDPQFMIFSRETDIRAPPNEPTILVNLHAESVRVLEAKCLSMNPVFPEYLAIGGSDAFIRMYDRRKLKCNVIEVSVLHIVTHNSISHKITGNTKL